MEGTYVRVVGSVRSVDGRRMLKTFRAFGLTDLNELTMHLAEVIHTHMALLVDSKKAPVSGAHFTRFSRLSIWRRPLSIFFCGIFALFRRRIEWMVEEEW